MEFESVESPVFSLSVGTTQHWLLGLGGSHLGVRAGAKPGFKLNVPMTTLSTVGVCLGLGDGGGLLAWLEVLWFGDGC